MFCAVLAVGASTFLIRRLCVEPVGHYTLYTHKRHALDVAIPPNLLTRSVCNVLVLSVYRLAGSDNYLH